MKRSQGKHPSRRLRKVALGSVAGLLLIALALEVSAERLQHNAASPYPIEATVRFLPSALDVRERIPALDEQPLPIARELRRGETLSDVFQELGLEGRDAVAAVAAATEILDPRRLRAGRTYWAFLDDGRLESVAFPFEDRGQVWVRRAGDRWASELEEYVLEAREVLVSGELSGALETSIREAGGPGMLAYRLADVLAWDLDFNRDLRLGDRFVILAEALYRDGALHRLGAVRAAIYETRGRRLEAYRFGDDGAYYDGEGRPLRKQFLRSPLEFSRVTSRFSNRRFHPVLKVYRPHYGVDYGAPTGTPVRVTANGVVKSAAWTKGGGRTVTVRHANRYETLYLHLSRFASGIRAGTRVSQGQVIGYVGSTGLATAPHLDYRVKQNGRYLDPLRLPNEPAPPLSADELERFLRERDRLRTRLEGAGAGSIGEIAAATSAAAGL